MFADFVTEMQKKKSHTAAPFSQLKIEHIFPLGEYTYRHYFFVCLIVIFFFIVFRLRNVDVRERTCHSASRMCVCMRARPIYDFTVGTKM